EHEGHATVGRGEPAEIRPSTLDARGDGVDRGANVNRLDTLGAELVLQHALHPVRTPPLLPVAIDRGVELLDRTRALVGREERALGHLPVKGLRAGGLTERVAGAREVPDRRDLEDLVPVPARELPRLGAARGHALPVAIVVLEERSRGVDWQRIIAPGFAQRAARFLELPAPGTRGGEHVE